MSEADEWDDCMEKCMNDCPFKEYYMCLENCEDLCKDDEVTG